MSDRKNYYLFAGLIIVVVVIFISRNKPSQIEIPNGNVPTIQKPDKVNSSNETPVVAKAIEPVQRAAQMQAIQQKASANEQLKKQVEDKNIAIKKSFGEEAFLQYTTSSKYNFLPKDLDDGMAGIVGRAGTPKEFVAIVARRGETSEKEIREFLPELSKQFPEISPEMVSSQVIRSPMPTEKDSNLKEGMWMVLRHKDLQLYIFRANRIDGKGSYMIVSQGNTIANPALVQDLQDTIRSLKAVPAK
tara:strand:+ start:144758 stop:145495 length:738 start_codon:yes stop_codon:yes gene_type:complete